MHHATFSIDEWVINILWVKRNPNTLGLRIAFQSTCSLRSTISYTLSKSIRESVLTQKDNRGTCEKVCSVKKYGNSSKLARRHKKSHRWNYNSFIHWLSSSILNETSLTFMFEESSLHRVQSILPDNNMNYWYAYPYFLCLRCRWELRPHYEETSVFAMNGLALAG